MFILSRDNGFQWRHRMTEIFSFCETLACSPFKLVACLYFFRAHNINIIYEQTSKEHFCFVFRILFQIYW